MREIAHLLVAPCMMLTATNVKVSGNITAKYPAIRYSTAHRRGNESSDGAIDAV